MIDRDSAFLDKALESLAGAESEFVNERYNNSANRAYYAVFHAAIAALQQVGYLLTWSVSPRVEGAK